ncbi:MAG: YraN family protein, partial [Oscillospiraceae bacterium]
MKNKEIGYAGEKLVAEFLESRGCEILCRNFTIRGGEIDIVAKDGEYLVFVEVK